LLLLPQNTHQNAAAEFLGLQQAASKITSTGAHQLIDSMTASAAAVAAADSPSTSGRSSDGRTVAVLVIGNPEAPELQALGPKMPAGAVLLGIGAFRVPTAALQACLPGWLFHFLQHGSHESCQQQDAFRA
jgi:hypothetical protein